MSKKRKLTYLALSILPLWVVGSYIGAIIATLPNPKSIPPADKYFDSPVENVTFKTSDSIRIAAWYLPNTSGKAVVLMNGYRNSRLGMIGRAKLYHERGFAVLLPDLRGTGESQLAKVTIGWQERKDLKAACDFLREKGKDSIAVHGFSLGAATIAYSLQDNPDYWFAVLESCYNNIDQTFQNRLDHYYAPNFIIPLLQHWTEKRIGATSAELDPEKWLKKMSCPTLIMAGELEYKVQKAETEAVFASCGAKQKELHIFEGAIHQDFLQYDKQQYKRVWGDFVAKSTQNDVKSTVGFSRQ